MKKLIAKIFLSVVFGTVYILVFWVCPLSINYLFTIRIFNVFIFHAVYVAIMALVLAVNAALKELLK